MIRRPPRSTQLGQCRSFSTTFSDHISNVTFIGRSPRRFGSHGHAHGDSFRGFTTPKGASSQRVRGFVSRPSIGGIYRLLENCCKNLGLKVAFIAIAIVLVSSLRERESWLSSVMRLASGCPGNRNVYCRISPEAGPIARRIREGASHMTRDAPPRRLIWASPC